MAEPWERDPIVGAQAAPWAADPIAAPAAPAAREVGAGEMFARRAMAGLGNAGTYAGRAIAAPAAIVDYATGGRTRLFDTVFDLIGGGAAARMAEQNALQPGERPATSTVAGVTVPTGEIAGGAGDFAAMLPDIIFGAKGTGAAKPMLEKGAQAAWNAASPILSRVMPDATRGATTMFPAATRSATQQYTDLIDKGVDPAQAAAAATVQGTTLMGMGAAPAAMPGTLPQRLATGAGFNVTSGMAARQAQNQVLPDVMQQPVADPAAMALDTLLGLAFGAAGPRRAGPPVRDPLAPQAPELARDYPDAMVEPPPRDLPLPEIPRPDPNSEQMVAERVNAELERRAAADLNRPLDPIYPQEPARAPLVGDTLPVEQPIRGLLPPPDQVPARTVGDPRAIEQTPAGEAVTPPMRDVLGRQEPSAGPLPEAPPRLPEQSPVPEPAPVRIPEQSPQPVAEAPIAPEPVRIPQDTPVEPPRAPEPAPKARRPKAPEESDQDRSRREWAENWHRVTGAPSLEKASIGELESAKSFGATAIASELRKGWSGGKVNRQLVDAMEREVEMIKAEIKRRAPPEPVVQQTAPALDNAPRAEALNGRQVEVEVEIGDTGKKAKMTVDAGKALSSIDSRLDALRRLMDCVK